MSLFESVETPEKARIAQGAGADPRGHLGAATGGRLGTAPAGQHGGRANGQRHGNADGAFGWQHALEQPEAACA